MTKRTNRRTPRHPRRAPPRSWHALSGLTFFHAAAQTGFGAFVSVWLTQEGWTQTQIGLALTIGTGAGLLGQLPGGVLVDSIHHHRTTAMAALIALGVSALMLALPPTQASVWGAQVLHALASCVIVPAIAAITLSLTGHARFGQRLGVNTRYAALGNGAAAAALGLGAYLLPGPAVFVITAILVIPAIVMLLAIRLPTHHVATVDHPALLPPKRRPKPAWHIFAEPALHVFAVGTVLFQLANAAMLPLALNGLTMRGESNGFVVALAITVPQVIMAALAPWAGRMAETYGRRPILLFGFAALPLRALLLALAPEAIPLILIQSLDAISGIMFGLLPPLLAADLTRRTGYLNLAIGSLGLAAGLGATFSTVLAGYLADTQGMTTAFAGLGFVALTALLVIWVAMPETKPAAKTD